MMLIRKRYLKIWNQIEEGVVLAFFGDKRKYKVMGGYFIGRPMDPESRPTKTKEASAESRVESHGLGWSQAGQGPCGERDSSEEEVQVQPGVLVWKDKSEIRTPYMSITRYKL